VQARGETEMPLQQCAGRAEQIQDSRLIHRFSRFYGFCRFYGFYGFKNLQNLQNL
jgi:hypothetical protein